MIDVDIVNKCLLGWACVCLLFLTIALSTSTETTKFFAFGPRENLVILDMKIDTGWKYSLVVLYTVISTLARTVLQEVLSPWLIQTVQNDKPKDAYARRYAQEVAVGEVIYRWFDWFMYMHILLAQVDMLIIELVGNLLAVVYTTRMYMRCENQGEEKTIQKANGCSG